jgi:hypothetical protein
MVYDCKQQSSSINKIYSTIPLTYDHDKCNDDHDYSNIAFQVDY